QKRDHPLEHKTECLILACVEEKKPSGTLKKFNDELAGVISHTFENKRFNGKPGQALLLNSNGKASNLLLVGIGKSKDVTAEKICQAAGTAAKLAEQSKFKSIAADLSSFEGIAKGKVGFYGELAGAMAEGVGLALYHFDNYKSRDEKDGPPSRIEKLTLLTASKSRQASTEKSIARAEKIIDAVHTARDLISHPGSTATPTFLAEHAKKMARKNKITCKALGQNEMEKLGMGSLLGVSQGSDEPPVLIVLEYN
ncbi:uncharacterized protein METZ01_LOCUS455454, partial [marine metagenome]